MEASAGGTLRSHRLAEAPVRRFHDDHPFGDPGVRGRQRERDIPGVPPAARTGPGSGIGRSGSSVVAVTGLQPHDAPRQPSLDHDPRWDDLAEAVDGIRVRFGRDAVAAARSRTER